MQNAFWLFQCLHLCLICQMHTRFEPYIFVSLSGWLTHALERKYDHWYIQTNREAIFSIISHCFLWSAQDMFISTAADIKQTRFSNSKIPRCIIKLFTDTYARIHTDTNALIHTDTKSHIHTDTCLYWHRRAGALPKMWVHQTLKTCISWRDLRLMETFLHYLTL